MDYSLEKHLFLALFWVLWCALHSLLIAPSVKRFFAGRLGMWFRYYRLLYIFIALGTIIPVLVYRFSMSSQPLFAWQGELRIIQTLLIGSALCLFIGGARNYDLRQFTGIRQIREGEDYRGIGDRGGLKTDGILGVIRHPWYLGGILIIWARPLDTAALVTNIILTSYLIIGAFLEERKLIITFGSQYRRYQSRVSMLFFPWKWLKKKVRNWLK
ncbi:MAG: methyltransferase family protein [Desulfurivibrionaceae bacterium]